MGFGHQHSKQLNNCWFSGFAWHVSWFILQNEGFDWLNPKPSQIGIHSWFSGSKTWAFLGAKWLGGVYVVCGQPEILMIYSPICFLKLFALFLFFSVVWAEEALLLFCDVQLQSFQDWYSRIHPLGKIHSKFLCSQRFNPSTIGQQSARPKSNMGAIWEPRSWVTFRSIEPGLFLQVPYLEF